MVKSSDLEDVELRDFILSSSENPAFQAGGKLVLKAYEVEDTKQFEFYTPTQLLPNVEKRLMTA